MNKTELDKKCDNCHFRLMMAETVEQLAELKKEIEFKNTALKQAQKTIETLTIIETCRWRWIWDETGRCNWWFTDCGHKMDEVNKYCPHCGRDIAEEHWGRDVEEIVE